MNQGNRTSNRLHKRQEYSSNIKWHLDEVFVKINGKQYYLWRAIDSDGEVLDV